LVQSLLESRNASGHWRGHLSSSALSTAVAVIALSVQDGDEIREEVELGLRWLGQNANDDGGYGDTVRSVSNLSTTLLVWAAYSFAEKGADAGCEAWIRERVGGLQPARIAEAVLAHYGSDRTFSVPILMTLTICGRLGEKGWHHVPQLPFELAVLPDRLFKWVKLSVVSYALPALIAIGLVKHVKRSSRNPIIRWLRSAVRRPVLRVLGHKQPENGGFLEATPLTAFVLMALVEAGEGELPVATRAASFLKVSMREDGSWPIDTDLATWLTTHAVLALPEPLAGEEGTQTLDWLLSQQWRRVHPFTNAAPGGWAWTDLPGGVPDADDTASALRAIHRLASAGDGPVLRQAQLPALDVVRAQQPCGSDPEPVEGSTHTAVVQGLTRLCDLQNRDGGIPTFCRGWGKLPFDRSCPDITANVLMAFALWREWVDPPLRERLACASSRALAYLGRVQCGNGAWIPLWFGNESAKGHENPVYGTAVVLAILLDLQGRGMENLEMLIEGGRRFLRAAQNDDGGWGGERGAPSTVEETSLAVRALSGPRSDTVERGILWLLERIEGGELEADAAPIGLYFASLWYSEELYPLLFATAALANCVITTESTEDTEKVGPIE
jgi:squalene-hopene/tetraprenyl-beta-curcumene cyclase